MGNSTNQCALKYLTNCIRNNVRGPKIQNFWGRTPRSCITHYIKHPPPKKFLKETPAMDYTLECCDTVTLMVS